MKLIEHIRGTGLSIDAWAKGKRMSPGTVRKYCADERIPRPREMKQIYEGSAGAVTPNDFYGLGPVTPA